MRVKGIFFLYQKPFYRIVMAATCKDFEKQVRCLKTLNMLEIYHLEMSVLVLCQKMLFGFNMIRGL